MKVELLVDRNFVTGKGIVSKKAGEVVELEEAVAQMYIGHGLGKAAAEKPDPGKKPRPAKAEKQES